MQRYTLVLYMFEKQNCCGNRKYLAKNLKTKCKTLRKSFFIWKLLQEQSDTEWKFARAKLWMSYFEGGTTVPPPFNIIPIPRILCRWLCRLRRKNSKNNSKVSKLFSCFGHQFSQRKIRNLLLIQSF